MKLIMKAITLQQPHAAAVFARCKDGTYLKRWETRSWRTTYRGMLAIHAGKKVDEKAGSRPLSELYGQLVQLRGVVLGTVEIVRCIPTEQLLEELGKNAPPLWGDFGPDRFAWELAEPRLFKVPIAARGMQGLWTWDAPNSAVAL